MALTSRLRHATRKPRVIRRVPQHVYGQGLIGCWFLSEGGGLTAFDASGKGGTGTLTGSPSWSLLGANRALSLPAESHVSIPDSARWAFSDMALLIRVKLNTSSGGANTQMITQDPGAGNAQWLFGARGVSGEGATSFWRSDAGGVGGQTMSGTAWSIDTAQTYTLGVTKSGLNFAFNRNGLPDGTAIATLGIPDIAAPLRIGHFRSDFNLNGTVEWVRIYDRALPDWLMARIHADPYDDLLRLSPTRYFFPSVLAPPPPPDVFRSASFPIEALQGLGRSATFPIEALQGLRRSASFPLETLLTPPLTLRDTWDVTVPLEARFTDSWDVVGESMAGFTLRDQWSVTENLPTFRDSWDVSEDLRVLASQVVQRPTVTVDKS